MLQIRFVVDDVVVVDVVVVGVFVDAVVVVGVDHVAADVFFDDAAELSRLRPRLASRFGSVVSSLDGSVGGFIGTFYALLTLLISAQQAAVPRDAYVAALLPVGLALYAAGEAGNLYHHALLARMRRPPTEQATMLRGMSALALAATPTTAEALAAAPEKPKSAYSVPHGGLFDVVAMPHYFFELCAWLGVALVAQQLNALLVFGGMASYLGGRAVATSRWYRAQFGAAWPEGRRHFVPFVF